MIERLRKWGFPKLKINSQQVRGKKLDEIEQIIRSMYNKQKGECEVVNAAVAIPKKEGKSMDRQEPKKKKKKVQRIVVEEESSDEDEDFGEGSDESQFD